MSVETYSPLEPNSRVEFPNVYQLRPSELELARQLRELGYRVGAIARWFSSELRPVRPSTIRRQLAWTPRRWS